MKSEQRPLSPHTPSRNPPLFPLLLCALLPAPLRPEIKKRGRKKQWIQLLRTWNTLRTQQNNSIDIPIQSFALTTLMFRFKQEEEAMKEFQVNGSTLCLSLFTDVTNSKDLLNSMQTGKLEPEVALLNASLIPDVFPLLAAAHKALLAKSRESLTTRTLHSELVYNYSGSKHISESLKRCGISDTTTYILAARFSASHEEMERFETIIHGKEIDLGELKVRANEAQIQKHYKISVQELSISSLSDAITCRIACRDAL